MGVLSRVRSLLPSAARAAEGEYRPGPYLLKDGWLSAEAGSSWNWWQRGYSPTPYSSASAMAQACISAYAQTVAMCPGDHWRMRADGGRDRVVASASALTRILRQPNAYQTISDFLLNLTWSLYDEGNGIALALRNNRFEVQELHLFDPRQCAARVAEDGSVFYDLGGNDILDRRFGGGGLHGVPARDVLHLRLHTRPGQPLKGISPLTAAALDMAASDAAMRQQVTYFLNQARPSFVLSTDQPIGPDVAKELRERWEAMTTGANAGRTPIMSWGVKPEKLGGTAADAQLADTLKMTDQHIALAFRMPLQVLGIGSNVQASTEALMNSWLASGLGFALNHIEEGFGILFQMKGQPEEYLELNTRALLRSSFKERMEALAQGVQASVYTTDEARNSEDLPSVPFGDQPRVQQQMVPLGYGAQLQPPKPAPEPAPAPPPEPAEEEPDDEGDDAGERFIVSDVERRLSAYAGLAH